MEAYCIVVSNITVDGAQGSQLLHPASTGAVPRCLHQGPILLFYMQTDRSAGVQGQLTDSLRELASCFICSGCCAAGTKCVATSLSMQLCTL